MPTTHSYATVAPVSPTSSSPIFMPGFLLPWPLSVLSLYLGDSVFDFDPSATTISLAPGTARVVRLSSGPSVRRVRLNTRG